MESSPCYKCVIPSDLPWQQTANQIEKREKTGIDFILTQTLLDGYDMCSTNLTKHIPKCDKAVSDGTILCRIGSISTKGIVFKKTFMFGDTNMSFALKIMPIYNSKAFMTNESEIRIASLVSDYVVSGRASCFLPVYGSAYCMELEVNPDYSDVIKDAHDYAIRLLTIKAIEDMVDIKPRFKTMLIKILQNPSIEINGALSRIRALDAQADSIKAIIEEIPKSVPIAAHVLLSELVWGDLNAVVDSIYNAPPSKLMQHLEKDSTLLLIIRDTIYAVQVLNRELNIVHNDLHTGNVMLRVSGGIIQPVIHDFGEAVEIKLFGRDDTVRDLQKFFDAMLLPKRNHRNKYSSRIGRVLEKLLLVTQQFLQSVDEIESSTNLLYATMFAICDKKLQHK